MITQLTDVTGVPDLGWVGVLSGALVALSFLVVLVLVVSAVISTLVNADTTAGGKLLWVLFILWLPVLGAVAWFVVGRKRHLNRFLGIDKNQARHSSAASVGQHSSSAGQHSGTDPHSGASSSGPHSGASSSAHHSGIVQPRKEAGQETTGPERGEAGSERGPGVGTG